MDETKYHKHFRAVTRQRPGTSGLSPYEYQFTVARHLFDGRDVVLRAPTGAGKTWAVIAPFLYGGWKDRPSRLIYALPLRTLAHGVYHEARRAAENLGHNLNSVSDKSGHEIAAPFVTLQTGEQPDDPFFARGTIIVTTYDQVLSGLLCGPYGLAPKLRNINGAAIAGAMVVFDEFHLMPPAMAFNTAAATLELFRGLCRSVWMTATATTPLRTVLASALDTVEIPADDAEFDRMTSSLESVTTVSRKLRVHHDPMCAADIVKAHQARSIVLLNTVDRAQAMFRALQSELVAQGCDSETILLHARFFKEHREEKEARLRELFGPGSKANAILVATQVIEAGIDISCENLHTELCPMNALVQRAGRCARFRNETGTVHVYPLPDAARNWLPYGDPTEPAPALERTREVLHRIGEARITPQSVAQWVEEVHADDDAHTLGASDLRGATTSWQQHQNICTERIRQSLDTRYVPISELIRGENDDSVRVVIADAPPTNPGVLDGLKLNRSHLASRLRGTAGGAWYWDVEQTEWKPLDDPADLKRTYAVCLSRSVANYDSQLGLIVGETGSGESPVRIPPPRPGHYALHEEAWIDHANAVAAEAEHRLKHDFPPEGMVARTCAQSFNLSYAALREAVRASALLHDLGKLQVRWYGWAEAYMREYCSDYVMKSPLAHTTFNPDNAADWERERSLQERGIRRPPHAQASALYAWPIINELLPSAPAEARRALGAGCLVSIVSHHGGWLPDSDRARIDNLISKWQEAVAPLLPLNNPSEIPKANLVVNKFGRLKSRLDHAVGADAFAEQWPTVSILIRILRLSDQRATVEAHLHE